MHLLLKLSLIFLSLNAFAQSDATEPGIYVPFYWEKFSEDNELIDKEPSTAPHIKVLAWNVGQSKFSSKLQNELSSNLEGLMRAPNSPDILVLVESNGSTLEAVKRASPEIFGYLNGAVVPYSKEFPWAYFIVLWKNKNVKFKGSKQFPLKAELDWSSLTSEEINYSENLKVYIKKLLPNLEYTSINQFAFEYRGKDFYLYPVHFSNIWPSMQQYFYPRAREGARHWMLPDFVEEKNANVSAKSFVLRELILGKLNPHAALIDQYLKKLNELHSQGARADSVMVVGDFNAFPRVEGLHGVGVRQVFNTDKSHACTEFEKHFKASYASPESVSFPSDTYIEAMPSTDYRLLIDLAYYRGSLWRTSRATVLPLSGSDHYPVFYEFLYNP